MKLKLTTAQTVALHTAESVGLSALITVVVGIFQYLSTAGLNLPGLGATAGVSFLGAMSMVYKSLSTNSQVMAGVADTVGEAKAGILAELQNITAALTGGKPVPAQLPAVTSPVALDVQRLAAELAAALMKTRQGAPVPPRPQIPDLPTQPQVDVVRTNTPPVPAQPPIYLPPNPSVSATQPPMYPPNTSATGTVVYPTQPPYQG